MEPLVELLCFAGSGVLLLLLLHGMARARSRPPRTAWESELGLELPPASVVERIFSPEDLSYAQATAAGVRRLFLQERTELALAWLNRIRGTAQALMGSHRAGVQRNRELSARREFRLLISLVILLALCEMLALCILLVGPFRTRWLLRPAHSLAGYAAASAGVRLISVAEAG